jgi:hypothetical protein
MAKEKSMLLKDVIKAVCLKSHATKKEAVGEIMSIYNRAEIKTTKDLKKCYVSKVQDITPTYINGLISTYSHNAWAGKFEIVKTDDSWKIVPLEAVAEQKVE